MLKTSVEEMNEGGREGGGEEGRGMREEGRGGRERERGYEDDIVSNSVEMRGREGEWRRKGE